MEKQIRTPLIDAVQRHMNKQSISFHVPGHKNGQLFPASLQHDFQSVLPYDVTELAELDDLHAPSGPIQEAQQLTANFYQAGHSFFLVGGSTVGNLAMIYAFCRPGDRVLVQRNCHKSVIHALELARVIPIFASPEYDQVTGHPIGLSADVLLKGLKLYPDLKAVVLTYPNYYGSGLNPAPLVVAAKEAGLYVLVDEAHAAHFIGGLLPPSSLSCGADAVVQSAHKMLPALTMGAYLHVHKQVGTAEVEAVKLALQMFQSSSPSYLIMASLDGARAYLERLTQKEILAIIAGVQAFKKEINNIPGLAVIEWSNLTYLCDPLKVTIKSETALTGFQLQKEFEAVGLYPELADERHLLLVFGLAPFTDTGPVIDRLTKVLRSYPVKRIPPPLIAEAGTLSERVVADVSPYTKRRIPLDESIGRIAGEAIIPYPPGVPLVLAGERIKAATVEQLERLAKAGARFQGHQSLADGISVVEVEEEG